MNEMKKNRRNTNQGQSGERGYALVGLMAVMMFALILTTAAAPTLQREMQREKEEEMLWRGQQVVVALSRYRAFRGGVFPTDLKELVEGIDINGKKLHLLRPSAICDPMTPCRRGRNQLADGQSRRPAYQRVAGGHHHHSGEEQGSRQPPGHPGACEIRSGWNGKAPRAARRHPTRRRHRPGRKSAGRLLGDNEQGMPIIGVVSKKGGKMFRTYYGIEEYDHALFFPNIPVLAGGFISPFVLGNVIPGGGSWRSSWRRRRQGSSVSRGRQHSLAGGALARQVSRVRSISDS